MEEERKWTLEEALELSRGMRVPTPRIGKIPTTKAIDRYIRLEGRLESTSRGSALQESILLQLSRLEAIGGVTTDDVIKRKQELKGTKEE